MKIIQIIERNYRKVNNLKLIKTILKEANWLLHFRKIKEIFSINLVLIDSI